MIERFLTYLSNIQDVSPATLRSYETDMLQYNEYVKSQNIDIANPDENAGRAYVIYLKSLKLDPNSINRKISALKSFYNFAIKLKLSNNNPFDRVRNMKTEKTLPEYFQYEEIQAIRSSALESKSDFEKYRNCAIIDFLYSTGCRISEAVTLDTNQLNLGEKSARVQGKGSKQRIVYLGEKCVYSMKDYLELLGYFLDLGNKKLIAQKPVFVNQHKKRITERGMFYIIDKMAEKCGIQKRVSPHVFRHSFATHMITEGADIRYVQEMLGHESLSTTQVYTHVGIGRLKNVYRNAHPHGGKKDYEKLLARKSEGE